MLVYSDCIEKLSLLLTARHCFCFTQEIFSKKEKERNAQAYPKLDYTS
jgi:hypothetical protein